jgi:dihydroxy-acid dehydratase
MDMLRRDLRPSKILTRKSIENAIASVAATGGSTNAVLHLLAIAREAGIALNIDDFDKISERTPLIADLKPGGRFVASDLYHAGGIQLIAKRLIDAGLIHGDTITVTGKTIAESAEMTKETAGQEVVRPMANPLKATGGLVILKGNLAPEGCVVKVAGHERMLHRGPARVFDREEDAFAAVQAGKIKDNDVVVIRYEGPKGGAGHARDARCDCRAGWRGLGRFGCTDHRRPLLGATHGLMAGHVAPEAAHGGPIAALRDGDSVVFDIKARRLDVEISEQELKSRLSTWRAPEPRYKTGVMAKYAKLVSSASKER